MKILTIILLTIVISGGLTLYLALPRNVAVPQVQESGESEEKAAKNPDEDVTETPENAPTKTIEEAQTELADYQNRIATAKAELAAIEEKIRTKTEEYNNAEQSEEKIQNLAKLFGSMKPDSAATIICNLEEDLATKIMTKVDGRSSSKLMDAIVSADPDYAARISKLMAGKPLISSTVGSKGGSQADVSSN